MTESNNLLADLIMPPFVCTLECICYEFGTVFNPFPERNNVHNYVVRWTASFSTMLYEAHCDLTEYTNEPVLISATETKRVLIMGFGLKRPVIWNRKLLGARIEIGEMNIEGMIFNEINPALPEGDIKKLIEAMMQPIEKDSNV